MNGPTRRLCTAAIGAAIAIIAVVAPMVGAGAASSTGCSATSGVTVIVDFTHFSGGDIERGCAPGHPASALDALHAAGFSSAGTAQYSDAFLCRIDDLPSPKHEACAVTPPASAFWAFWTAQPSDASWTYSTVGVLDYQPASGSIEGFAFGSRAQPSVSPADALSTPTTPGTSPPTKPPTTRGPVVSGATVPHHPTTTNTSRVTVVPSSPAPSSTARSPGTTTRTTGPTTSSARTPTPRSTPRSAGSSVHTTGPSSSSTPRIVDRSAAGPLHHDSSGSPLPAILTIIVVGSLAIGAFVLSRTRRNRPA